MKEQTRTLSLIWLLGELITSMLALLIVGGCAAGTTNVDLGDRANRAIGNPLTGYTWNAETGVVDYMSPVSPSHTTLAPDGAFDVVSPVQPSVISVRVDPDMLEGAPLSVFMSSAADYAFDSAHFERGEDGSLVMTVEGFSANRSDVMQTFLAGFSSTLTAQIEAGSITEREAIAAWSAVIQAIAEAGIDAAAGLISPL